MSPAFGRYVVSGFDFDPYDIVVQAGSREDALRKAEAIYNADGLGYTPQHSASPLSLRAEFIGEAQQ